MLDSLILISAGLAFAGMVALANPVLMGWRSRRDAVMVLLTAAVMLAAGWLAHGI